MHSSLRVRITGVIAVGMIIAGAFLAVLLRNQTVSQFVVYLSSQEQVERFAPTRRVLVRFHAERIGRTMRVADDAGVRRLVDAMAEALDDEIVVARNDERFYASAGLRGNELDLSVTDGGLLVASVRRDASVTELELSPLITQEISAFTVESGGAADFARFYRIPDVSRRLGELETAFVRRTTRVIILLTVAVSAGMLALTWVVLSGALRPVRRLTEAARAASRDGRPSPIEVSGPTEISTLAAEFNTMVDRIRRAEELRRRLLTDASHELRGPLANLRLQIEAMQDGLLPPSAESLSSLHEETLLLARLVDDLHLLALAESDGLPQDRAPVSAGDMVDEAVRGMGQSFHAAGVALQIAPIDSGLRVRADGRQMAGVIRNLLANALRYAGDGGRVTVSVTRSGEEIVFTVSDTGPGVDPEELDLIFERFYRTDPSRARSSGGSGLGLAIARAVVAAHGGTIAAANRETGGLDVRVCLPKLAEESQDS